MELAGLKNSAKFHRKQKMDQEEMQCRCPTCRRRFHYDASRPGEVHNLIQESLRIHFICCGFLIGGVFLFIVIMFLLLVVKWYLLIPIILVLAYFTFPPKINMECPHCGRVFKVKCCRWNVSFRIFSKMLLKSIGCLILAIAIFSAAILIYTKISNSHSPSPAELETLQKKPWPWPSSP